MGDINLAQAFQSFARSAWRLESRDEYTSPGEAAALAAWRAGKRPRNSGWLEILTGHIAAGRAMGRVHALTLPLTEYLRFELATYEASSNAGETIGIADRRRHPELCEDFWIFDDSLVAVLHYDDTGRLTHATDGTADLDRYRHLRDAALAAAVPLADWTPLAA